MMNKGIDESFITPYKDDVAKESVMEIILENVNGDAVVIEAEEVTVLGELTEDFSDLYEE